MNAHEVGVHMLTHAGSRPEWVQDAVGSLAGESVALTMIEDHEAHIGRRRAEGFRLSTGRHEFVSFVDSDDRVLPGAFAACLEALQASPEAAMAFTLEERIDASGNIVGGPIKNWEYLRSQMGASRFAFHYAHHLCVYRLALVAQHLDEMAAFPFMAESVLHARVLSSHSAVLVPRVGYQWRQHPGQTSRTAPPEWRGLAIRHICPLLREMA